MVGPVAAQEPMPVPVPSVWMYVPSAWKMAVVGGLLEGSLPTSSSQAPTIGLSAVVELASCARVVEASPPTARRPMTRMDVAAERRRGGSIASLYGPGRRRR